jgi:hypothetical protein
VVVEEERNRVEVAYGHVDVDVRPEADEPASVWESVALLSTLAVGLLLGVLCVLGL